MAVRRKGTIKVSAKGEFACRCGKSQNVGASVNAHWHIAFLHKCKCGARYCITGGRAEPIGDETPGNVHILKGDIIHVPRSKR